MDNNDLKQIQDKAISLFSSGYNCSQSVISSFSEILNLDNNAALAISCGFGGGMGRTQGTCGAVTGAYMAIGVYCTNKYENIAERKEKTYSMIQEFNRVFVEKHKVTDCRQLLNCDLKTEDGQKYFKENNLVETVCKKCIVNSIEIVNDQMK